MAPSTAARTRPKRPRLAIFTDFRAWHERELQGACARRGIDARLLSLRECGFAVPGRRHGLHLPGFEDALPGVALVRFIPGGSFQQITLWLGVLHALAGLGVAVHNSARAIERTVDKSTTSFLLQRAGVDTPPSWALASAEPDVVARLLADETAAGRELVLKPLFGSRGQGLRRLGAGDELPPPDAPDVDGVYYLQRFIVADEPGCDWRVLVAGGRALAAMRRRAEGWISNRARGGVCLPAELDPALADAAVRATGAVGASYAGVDLIRDRDGRVWVLEVNGVPAWQGLQSVNPKLDIAARLLDAMLPQGPPGAGDSGAGRR